MREKVRTVSKQFLTQCVLPAAVMNLFIETLSRCSLWKAVGYLLTSPLIFLYNTLIIAVTLSVTQGCFMNYPWISLPFTFLLSHRSYHF